MTHPRFRLLSWLFGMLTILSAVNAFIGILIIVTVNKGFTSGAVGLPYEFLAFMPMLNLFPLLQALASVVFAYLTVRISHGDRSTYLQGVWGVIVLLVLSSVASIVIAIQMSDISRISQVP